MKKFCLLLGVLVFLAASNSFGGSSFRQWLYYLHRGRMYLPNKEHIRNSTDDIMSFYGDQGSDDTDVSFDLDGAAPVIYSVTDGKIQFNDTVEFLSNVSIAGLLTSSGTVADSAGSQLDLGITSTVVITDKLMFIGGGTAGDVARTLQRQAILSTDTATNELYTYVTLVASGSTITLVDHESSQGSAATFVQLMSANAVLEDEDWITFQFRPANPNVSGTTRYWYEVARGDLGGVLTVDGFVVTESTSTRDTVTIGWITDIRGTGISVTYSTSTNISGTRSVITDMIGTGLSVTESTSTRGTITTGWIPTLFGTNFTATESTSTRLNSSLGIVTDLRATAFSATESTSTDFAATRSLVTERTGTGLSVTESTSTRGTITTGWIPTLHGTAFTATESTSTRLNSSLAIVTEAEITSLTATNSTMTVVLIENDLLIRKSFAYQTFNSNGNFANHIASPTIQSTCTFHIIRNAGPTTITLPEASTCPGKEFYFKIIHDTADGNLVFQKAGSDTIDDDATCTIVEGMHDNAAYKLINDGGTAWYVVGSDQYEQ